MAEGILPGPIGSSHGFVDDDHALALRSVAPGKISAAAQRNPQRFEIAWGDHIETGHGNLSRSRRRTSLDRKTLAAASECERDKTDGGSGFHAGESGDALDSLLVKGAAAGRLGMSFSTGNHAKGEDTLRLKAQRHAFEKQKAAKEKTRGDHDDDTERGFQNDQ